MDENNLNLSQLDIQKIDSLLLNFLKNKLLANNIWFINFYDELWTILDISNNKNLFYTTDELKQRVMYNIWLWFIELKIIENTEENILKLEKFCEEKELNIEIFIKIENDKKEIISDKYLDYFLNIKITSDWLKELEKIDKEISSQTWFNWIILKIKELQEKLWNLKLIIWIIATILSVLSISIFNLKASEIIKKIPLLSSVINIETIEEFEKLNEDDKDYEIINSINSKSLNWQKITKIEIKKQDKDKEIKDSQWSQERIFRVTLDNNKKEIIKLAKTPEWYKLVIDSLKKEINIPLNRISSSKIKIQNLATKDN